MRIHLCTEYEIGVVFKQPPKDEPSNNLQKINTELNVLFMFGNFCKKLGQIINITYV